LTGLAGGLGPRLEEPTDASVPGIGVPPDASATAGRRGRGAVLSGVLLSVDNRRSVAVIGDPDGTAHSLRVGDVLEGMEVREISEKGMIVSGGRRTVFVPLGGPIPMKNKNGGR